MPRYTIANVVKLLQDWKDEIVSLNRDYTTAISQLDQARNKFVEEQKKCKTGIFATAQPYMLKAFHGLVIIIVIMALIFLLNRVECGITVEVFSITVSKNCP